jgi:hypothetical protein
MPAKIRHNKPHVIVALPPEMADFIIENCKGSIDISLRVMQFKKSKEGAECIVEMVEKFKELKHLIEAAKKSES